MIQLVNICNDCLHFKEVFDDRVAPEMDGWCRLNPPVVFLLKDETRLSVYPEVVKTAHCQYHLHYETDLNGPI